MSTADLKASSSCFMQTLPPVPERPMAQRKPASQSASVVHPPPGADSLFTGLARKVVGGGAWCPHATASNTANHSQDACFTAPMLCRARADRKLNVGSGTLACIPATGAFKRRGHPPDALKARPR
jgi:hypothetical protein